MRKLVALMHTSLDAKVAPPNGALDWIKHDDQVWDFVHGHIGNADSGVYGPVTFGMMEAYWPSMLHDSTATGHTAHHAKWYAAASKYVFSRKLTALSNPNARLINTNLTEEIQLLKQQPGKNLMLFGSPRLLHTLAQLELIDEYVLTLNPVVLGGGIPLFPEGMERCNLKLNEVRQFKTGSVGLPYLK